MFLCVFQGKEKSRGKEASREGGRECGKGARKNYEQGETKGERAKRLGKTKTPQTVTLQVKIERRQKLYKNSARSPRPCSCLPPAPKLPSTKKQLNFHLECCHLQCFSFARMRERRKWERGRGKLEKRNVEGGAGQVELGTQRKLPENMICSNVCYNGRCGLPSYRVTGNFTLQDFFFRNYWQCITFSLPQIFFGWNSFALH